MSSRSVWKAGLFAVALFAVPSGSSWAETLRVMQGAPTSALNVPMNRAVVVESDEPFAELSIANPGIADISTLSDRSIYVLGKAPGRTTLTLLSADGRLISNVDVHVSPDVAEFKERLRQILPDEPIEVRTANDGVVDQFTSTTPTTVVGWQQVLAIRIGVLARSQAYQRPDPPGSACTTTTTAPTWTGGTFTTPETIPSCYRYSVFETVVPLRNMIWRGS